LGFCWIFVLHVGDLYKEYLAKSVSEATLISIVESNELGFGLAACFLSLFVGVVNGAVLL
jgi:hypothetical protein